MANVKKNLKQFEKDIRNSPFKSVRSFIEDFFTDSKYLQLSDDFKVIIKPEFGQWIFDHKSSKQLLKRRRRRILQGGITNFHRGIPVQMTGTFNNHRFCQAALA